MHARLTSIAVGFFVVGSVRVFLSAEPALQLAQNPLSFEKDVQPILETSCLSCHGDAVQSGKLDLRSRDAALKGGARGADLVPGDPEASRLYRRIAGLEQPSMPAQGTQLTAEQVRTIKRWIEEGAIWTSATLASTAGPSA